ncbi:MAG: glycosyltransferase family 4 protein [Pseudomonadota bacterium]
MRILFLSHYFPPEVNAPASRTFEHCRRWVEAGHSVTVITCAPNHPRGEVYAGYENKYWQRESVAGVEVIRVWTYLSANKGFAKRTLNYVSFMFSSIAACLFVRRPDVVITTSPQFFNGLAGYVVGILKWRPWVLEIRDLWPDSILAVGAIKNPAVIGFLKGLERFAYHKADLLVPVTDAFSQHMQNLGVDSAKIAVLKNGVNMDFYLPDQSDTDADRFRETLGIKGKFVAAYFGTHGMAHHLETIFEAADLLQHREDISFLMVGDGAERDRLAGMLEQRRLSNVSMLAQQPKEMMPTLWASCDASLVLLRKSELFKTVLPSKMFEAMAMKKPIVLGVEGEAQELLTAADAGVTIEPESAVALARAVEGLANEPALCQRHGECGRRYVEQHHDRASLAVKYVELLEGVAIGKVMS